MNLLLQLLITALILVSALPDDPVQKLLFLAGLCGYIFFRREVLSIKKCRKLLICCIILQGLIFLREKTYDFSVGYLINLIFGINIIGISLFLMLSACLITIYRKVQKKCSVQVSEIVPAGLEDSMQQREVCELEIFGWKPDPEVALLLGIFVIQSSVWSVLAVALGADDVMFAYIIAASGTAVILLLAAWLCGQYKKDQTGKFWEWLIVGSAPLLGMIITEVAYNPYWIGIYTLPAIINLILYVSFFLLVMAIVGNWKVAVLSGYVISFLWGLLNSYLIRFKNSPLIPSDLASARTGLSVMGQYNYAPDITGWMAIALLVLCFRIIWRMRERLPGRISAKKRLIALLSGGYILALCCWGMSLEPFIVKKDNFWWLPQTTFYDNGALVSFATYCQLQTVKEPEGYTKERANEILSRYELPEERMDGMLVSRSLEVMPAAEPQKPNLIVIMNEAYSDLRTAGDFQTTEEYMPYWKSLENTISGLMYVSVFGNQTANTEFEFLTGSSMALYPNNGVAYIQYITNPVEDGLVSILKQQEYARIAVHPFVRNSWNRPKVYEYMGFEDYISIEDFENSIPIRGLASDESSYDKDMELFESKKENDPLFLFNVTIQNHGGYVGDDFPDNHVKLQGLSREYEDVDNYLSLVKESDRALEKLITYFENVPEPTVIVMFGDHQPGVDTAFYEEIMGKNMEDWTIEDWQKKYRVPYFIWANYDIEDQREDTSANYLFTKVLEIMGEKGSSYSRFLKDMKQVIPVMNAKGFMDEEGNWYEYEDPDIPEEIQTWLREYQYVNYRNIFDRD